MAITITTQTAPLEPVYNPQVYEFTSTNYTKQGFRYLVDIYSGNSTTLITRQKIAPQLDGSGKVDISRILANYVSVDFDGISQTVNPASNSFFKYSIKIGEEYKPDDWVFTGTTYVGFDVQLKGSPLTPNTFIVGDQIIIKTSNDSSLLGLHTVVAPVSTTLVTTDFSSLIIGSKTGTTNYANGQKLTFSGLTAVTNQTVFNGVVSFKNYPNYSSNLYTINTVNTFKQALTDLPLDNFYATENQSIWLNWYIKKDTPYLYNFIIETPEAGAFVMDAVNFDGLTEIVQFKYVFSNTSFDYDTTKFVDVYIARSSGAVYEQMSTKYRIWLDKRCRINEYEVAFQDRMGSIGSFAFQLRDKETGTIQRIQYNKELPTIAASTDRGYTNIWIGVDKELDLNTDWMTEEMSIYFEQLLTSPYTWLKLDDGLYYAILITDSSFEIEHQRNKRLIRKTIKIKLANRDKINI